MVYSAKKRFFRYASFGMVTFAFDLVLLWLFIQVFEVPYLYATAIAFLIALSVNYFLSRRFVFKGTNRPVGKGYMYFIAVAILGAAVTTFCMWLLSNYTDLHFTIARTLIAAVIGLVGYIANLFLNFKVAKSQTIK